MKFENAAFTDTSKFFYERIRKIGDLRLQSVQRAFEAQFATKTVEERKAADFLVALDGGPLPNGQTRYAYPSKPADYAYLVGLCPRGRKDGGIVEYDCSWKFFEVSGGCSVAPEISEFILERVTRPESTKPAIPTATTKSSVTERVYFDQKRRIRKQNG